MAYHNPTQGARAIHFHTGNYQLVEAGATVEVDPARVKRLAPGLVVAENKLPKVPKKLAEKAKGDGGDDLKALRAEYKAKLGKNPFNGWSAAELQEKIAAA